MAWVVVIAVVLIDASVGISITSCCPQFGIAITRCLNWIQRLSTSLSTTTDTPQQEEPSLCDLEFLIIPEVVYSGMPWSVVFSMRTLLRLLDM